MGKGASLGAKIGTAFGSIGIAIGGFIGETIGYMAGSKAGETVVKGARKIREPVVKDIKSIENAIKFAGRMSNGIKIFIVEQQACLDNFQMNNFMVFLTVNDSNVLILLITVCL